MINLPECSPSRCRQKCSDKIKEKTGAIGGTFHNIYFKYCENMVYSSRLDHRVYYTKLAVSSWKNV